MTRLRQFWPWWRWALTGLSALALTLSTYLSWHSLVGSSLIGCGGGSTCDQVLSSRWSAIGGILPVSGLAVGAYLAMLLDSLFIGPATAPPIRRLAWRAMLVLVGAAAGSALWFSIVQNWIIHAFCPYCMATHIIGLLLAGLVVLQAPRQSIGVSTHVAPRKPARNATSDTMIATADPDVFTSAPRQVINVLPAVGLVFAGLTIAAIMAVCQVSLTPKAVYRGGESQVALPAIDPHEVPLIGSPDAPYVVALLFDYNCPHCQQLHFLLDEAVRRYDGKLAFALCPAPLNSQCNPYIPVDVDEFKDSCELAKVALTVWVARREAFPVFDRWMFSMESGDLWRPRTLDAARAKAIQLVGQAKFDAAQSDPWITRYMQSCLRIYGDTLQSGNAVPKLVFNSRWVTPSLYDADDLISVLQVSLAVPKP